MRIFSKLLIVIFIRKGVIMLKLSIIIATYNSGKTLKQALDSIRYQTYTNIETIVVDGLSTDNTIEVIREYADVVTKYISEKDTGIYNAFNKGINLAHGDYICFLGSDDCYLNYNVIEKLMNELDGQVNVLSAPIICVETDGYQFLYTNKFTRNDILNGLMLPHPGLLVRTRIMKEYMFNENNKIISDYEFLLRYILNGGNLKFVDFPVVYFSLEGISSGGFNDDKWKLNVYEHLKLYQDLNLDKKYIFAYLNNTTNYEHITEIKFNIIMLLKNIFEKLKIKKILERILQKKNKHKCNLKYCRWCGRTSGN